MKFNERKDFSIMKLVKNIFLSSFICLILACAGAYGATPGGSSGNDNGSESCVEDGKYYDASTTSCEPCHAGYACSGGSISTCSITDYKIQTSAGQGECVDVVADGQIQACNTETTTQTNYILVYPDGAAYGCGDTIGENTHCPDGFEQKTITNNTFVVTYCQQCAPNKISVGGAACQACASGYTTIRENSQDTDCQDPLNGLGCKSCVKKTIKMCLEINRNSICSDSFKWPDGLLIGKVNTSNIRKKSKWYNTIGVFPGCENAVYIGGMVQCQIK